MNNKINLIIEVEEKQTGTFNAGVSVGTLRWFCNCYWIKREKFLWNWKICRCSC